MFWSQEHSPYQRIYHTLLPLLFFTLLLVIDAWPVLSQIDQFLVGSDIDTYINPWADWWTAKALRDPEITFWHTDHLFYPQGASLIYHSFSHLNTAVSLFLQSFLEPIPAYNLAILLNYILTSLSAFHLTHYLTKSTIAGLLAGIIFGFNTHYVYQSGHPVLLSIWCIPWFTLYFMRAIRENKIRYIIVAALFYFFAASASILLFIIVTLWGITLTFSLLFSVGRTNFPYRLLFIFGSISLIAISPLIYPLLKETIHQGQSNFIITDGRSQPSDLATFITPPWYRWERWGVYLGLPLLLLLLFIRPQKAKWWSVMFMLVCLIAIGPEPRWADEPLNIILPWSLPIVPLLRHAHRLNILISFSFSIIAAYGWAEIAQRLHTRAIPPSLISIAGIALILLIYIDYTRFPFPKTEVNVSAFYTDFLEDVPQNISLATVPFGRQQDKRYLFYQTFHQHPITGGVISRPLPDTYAFIEQNPLLQAGIAKPDAPAIPQNAEQELANLAQKNIGYLVIHKNLLTHRQVENWRRALPPLSSVFEDEQLIAYDIRGIPD